MVFSLVIMSKFKCICNCFDIMLMILVESMIGYAIECWMCSDNLVSALFLRMDNNNPSKLLFFFSV